MDKLLKKKWSSLTQLKDYIESNLPEEEVCDFNGYELVTTKARYTLDQDGLKVNPK